MLAPICVTDFGAGVQCGGCKQRLKRLVWQQGWHLGVSAETCCRCSVYIAVSCFSKPLVQSFSWTIWIRLRWECRVSWRGLAGASEWDLTCVEWVCICLSTLRHPVGAAPNRKDDYKKIKANGLWAAFDQTPGSFSCFVNHSDAFMEMFSFYFAIPSIGLTL